MSKKPVPKAKKGKKGKKKGGDETSLEERYKRTLQEVATLRLELGNSLIITLNVLFNDTFHS